MNNIIKKLGLFLALLTIVGCNNSYVAKVHKNTKKVTNKTVNAYTRQQDSHPHQKDIPNLALVKEPLPKHEPKSRYGNPDKYTVLNKTYNVLQSSNGYKESGYASWYGTKFHGFRTSSGEIYDMYEMTAAHKTLPLPTYAKVTNLSNNRSIIVKINDRGPFHANRIVDLSYAAADKLGILGHGVGKVEVVAINTSINSSNITTQMVNSSGSSKYNAMLQLGAFTMPSNAQKLASKLKDLLQNHQYGGGNEYEVNILEHSLQKGDKKNILYKVVISSVNRDFDMQNLKKILAKIPSQDSFIID